MFSVVNGFLCTCSCDVAKAKRGVDPHPSTTATQNPAKPETKNGVVTDDKGAVTFGGVVGRGSRRHQRHGRHARICGAVVRSGECAGRRGRSSICWSLGIFRCMARPFRSSLFGLNRHTPGRYRRRPHAIFVSEWRTRP